MLKIFGQMTEVFRNLEIFTQPNILGQKKITQPLRTKKSPNLSGQKKSPKLSGQKKSPNL